MFLSRPKTFVADVICQTSSENNFCKCFTFRSQALKGYASMADLYTVSDATVTKFMGLRWSVKNYFGFFIHLIGYHFSIKKNFFPPPVPYQPPNINKHMILTTNSNKYIKEYVHTNKNIFVFTSVRFLNSFFDKKIIYKRIKTR